MTCASYYRAPASCNEKWDRTPEKGTMPTPNKKIGNPPDFDEKFNCANCHATQQVIVHAHNGPTKSLDSSLIHIKQISHQYSASLSTHLSFDFTALLAEERLSGGGPSGADRHLEALLDEGGGGLLQGRWRAPLAGRLLVLRVRRRKRRRRQRHQRVEKLRGVQSLAFSADVKWRRAENSPSSVRVSSYIIEYNRMSVRISENIAEP